MGGRDFPPSHPDSTSRVIRGDTAVSTATEAGSVAPVDLAGITVLAVARMELSAVAEVHSSAVDNERCCLRSPGGSWE